MDDADFERTVEELYGDNKPVDVSQRTTHLVELEAIRRGDSHGKPGEEHSRAVDTQPRARPSMEAPRRSRERSRSPMQVPLPEGEGAREQRGHRRSVVAPRRPDPLQPSLRQVSAIGGSCECCTTSQPSCPRRRMLVVQ